MIPLSTVNTVSVPSLKNAFSTASFANQKSLLNLLKRFSIEMQDLSDVSAPLPFKVSLDQQFQAIYQYLHLKQLIRFNLSWIPSQSSLQSKRIGHDGDLLRQISKLDRQLKSFDRFNTHCSNIKAGFQQLRDLSSLFTSRAELLGIDIRTQLSETAPTTTQTNLNAIKPLQANGNGHYNYSDVSKHIVELKCPVDLHDFKVGESMAILYNKDQYSSPEELFKHKHNLYGFTVDTATQLLQAGQAHPCTREAINDMIIVDIDSLSHRELYPGASAPHYVGYSAIPTPLSASFKAEPLAPKDTLTILEPLFSDLDKQVTELGYALYPYQVQIDEINSYLYKNCRKAAPLQASSKVSLEECHHRLNSISDVLMLAELIKRNKVHSQSQLVERHADLKHHFNSLGAQSSEAATLVEQCIQHCHLHDQQRHLESVISFLSNHASKHESMRDICDSMISECNQLITQIGHLEHDLSQLIQQLSHLQHQASKDVVYDRLIDDCLQQITVIKQKLQRLRLSH